MRPALPVALVGLSAALVAGAGTAVAGHAAFTDGPFGVHDAGVHFVSEAGITSGCTATAYCPGQPVTRAQMATFLHTSAQRTLAAAVVVVEGEIADGAGLAACPTGAFAAGGGFLQDEGQRNPVVVDTAYYDEANGEDVWLVGLEDPVTGELAGTGLVTVNCVFPASVTDQNLSAMASPPERDAAALVERARAR